MSPSPGIIDLKRRRFGRLRVIGLAPKRPGCRAAYWRCRCRCGNIVEVRGDALRHPRHGTRSCGCYNNAKRIRHGGSQTREYDTYCNMLYRCTNPDHPRYADWGGRGIKVCRHWSGPKGFIHFLTDMGSCPPGHTLDRKDVDDDYRPGNCRWLPHAAQARNRRNNRFLTAQGKTQCLAAWAEETGMHHMTITYRIDTLGWDEERALMTSPRSSRRKGE
jgi:hypothetical protein